MVAETPKGSFPSKTTEIVTLLPNGDWSNKAGGDLPKAVYGHCIVAINATTLLMTGGQLAGGMYSADSLWYNKKTHIWTKGPKPEQGKKSPMSVVRWSQPKMPLPLMW